MFLFVIIIIFAVIGFLIYRLDKKLSRTYEDKFNAADWHLPAVSSSGERLPDEKAQSSSQSLSEIRYEKNAGLFSPAEQFFFNVLQAALYIDYIILAKVNAANVINVSPNKNTLAWQAAVNQLAGAHFGFVICDKDNLQILCCIEFNCKALQERKQFDRYEMLNEICKSMQLPLIVFHEKPAYVIQDIRKQVLAAIGKIEKPYTTMQDNAKNNPHESPQNIKFCPKCSGVMVKRKAKNGTHQGKLFWTCSAYPTCKVIEIVQ